MERPKADDTGSAMQESGVSCGALRSKCVTWCSLPRASAVHGLVETITPCARWTDNTVRSRQSFRKGISLFFNASGAKAAMISDDRRHGSEPGKRQFDSFLPAWEPLCKRRAGQMKVCLLHVYMMPLHPGAAAPMERPGAPIT